MIDGEFDKHNSDFWSGKYRNFLLQNLDRPNCKISDRQLPFIIGALVFTGRYEEAELLFQSGADNLELAPSVISRFYLAIGKIRMAEYTNARNFLILNVKSYFSNRAYFESNSFALFFIFQGLAFYRYFCGRLPQALKWSDKALKIATQQNYIYGKVLVFDIRGHVLTRTGSVSSGLKSFDQALQFANILGNGDLAETLKDSIIHYTAKHGIGNIDFVAALEKHICNDKSENNYSSIDLNLELTRQYILRGNLKKSKEILEKLAYETASTRNHRQVINVLLIRAHISFLEFQYDSALLDVEKALNQCNSEVDCTLERCLLGLKFDILLKTDPRKSGDILERLFLITMKSGDSIGFKMLARKLQLYANANSGNTEVTLKYQILVQNKIISSDEADKISKCMDTILSESLSFQSLQLITESQFYGLLRSPFETLTIKTGIVLDLIPRALIVVDNGTILVQNEELTPLLRTLLVCLGSGKSTKEEIVQSVWGYDYHPLKHNPLLYKAISKLRILLADRKSWIDGIDGNYSLSKKVQIYFWASNHIKKETNVAQLIGEKTEIASTNSENRAPSDQRLNHRQLWVLRHLHETESIDVQKYRELFQVSLATATRDLSGLSTLFYIVKIGQGRATKYELAKKR